MFDKLLKTLQDTGETLKEQASHLGSGAREKAYAIIEDWLGIFPVLIAMGFKVESFALSAALSPALDVDLVGTHADFTEERLAQLMEEQADNRAVKSVLTTIKTTYGLHRQITAELREPLIVQIRIRLSPEVKVFIGAPLVD